MRRLLLSTLAVLACAAPAPSGQSTAKELRGLKGPVKTVRTKWRTAPSGRVEMNCLERSIISASVFG